jgi:hypothetical protein
MIDHQRRLGRSEETPLHFKSAWLQTRSSVRQDIERAGLSFSVAERERGELGRPDFGEPAQLRNDVDLVAENTDAGRAFDTIQVEHHPVGRRLTGQPEGLNKLAPRRLDVICGAHR